MLACLGWLGLLAQTFNFSSSNLPIFVITTEGGRLIPDNPKILADLKVLWRSSGERNFLSDTEAHYNGKVGIELRGSTSQFLSDKKPYGIELRTTAGAELPFALLGMPQEEDWVLAAPYSDKSLMREVLTYSLAGSFMAWSPRARFCELTLNGDYRGIYVLTEKIKRGKNRVAISKMDSTSVSGDALTGGYILKIDKTTGNPTTVPVSFTSLYLNPNRQNLVSRTVFQYHYPDPTDLKTEQRTYIRNAVNEMETAMNSVQFADPSVGYAKYWDVNSLVDFFIVNELTRNVDGYRLSSFFYKDKNSVNSKFKMGPVWDFNIALGNADYCDGDKTTGWAWQFNDVCPSDSWSIPFWWHKLFSDPNFKGKIRARWQSLRQNQLTTNRVTGMIDSMKNLLNEAQVRNFQKFQILGRYVWPNKYVGPSYTLEVDYLKSWTLARIAWLDGQINAFPVTTQEIAESITVSPNPSAAGFHFHFNLKNETAVELLIYNDLGQIVFQKKQKMAAGSQTLSWDTPSVSRGFFVYQIRLAGQKNQIGKLVKF